MAVRVVIDQKALQQALQAFPKEVSKALRQGIKEAAATIQKEAVDNSGFTTRSGNLNRRIKDPSNVTTETSGMGGKITFANTNTVPYAIIQHEGGRGIKPKKFLTRAATAKEQRVYDIFDKAIDKAIKIAGL